MTSTSTITITDPHGVVWTWNPTSETYETSAFRPVSDGPVYALARYIKSGDVSSFWLSRMKRTQ